MFKFKGVLDGYFDKIVVFNLFFIDVSVELIEWIEYCLFG